MEKITSFTIDHIKLQPGIYVSRKDPVGGSMITTFDIRMTSPNEEPVMNTAELHTIEHLAATFLRNHKEFGSKMIYWGPMGCRTGNYLLLNGDYESKDIVPLMIETFEFIRDFEGEVPGASAKDCGNYLDMNLPMAKYLAEKGSVTVDGISLTINYLRGNILSLNLIPHTAERTNIGTWQVGSKVNLEVDVLARYIERLLLGDKAAEQKIESNISMAFLAENGFLK